MSDKATGLLAVIEAVNGLPASLLIAVGAGRLMWHTGEVRQGRRKFLGRELALEAPIILGMTFLLIGVADYLGLSAAQSGGLGTVLGWLGPRGIEVALYKFVNRKT
jgi:hypothetical protein